MITQEQLKKIIHYSPETGSFTWLIQRGKASPGKSAGHVCYKNTKQYLIIGVNGRIDRAHRLAWLYMTGSWPTMEIDHINGNGLDNSWSNLREVDRQTNCRNMRLHSHNTSGVAGVSWRKQKSKWRSYIVVNNKQLNLGHFCDWFDAVCARKSAEIKHSFHPNHGSKRPL